MHDTKLWRQTNQSFRQKERHLSSLSITYFAIKFTIIACQTPARATIPTPIHTTQQSISDNKSPQRIILPTSGSRDTKHWYWPYQTLVLAVPTTGTPFTRYQHNSCISLSIAKTVSDHETNFDILYHRPMHFIQRESLLRTTIKKRNETTFIPLSSYLSINWRAHRLMPRLCFQY